MTHKRTHRDFDSLSPPRKRSRYDKEDRYYDRRDDSHYRRKEDKEYEEKRERKKDKKRKERKREKKEKKKKLKELRKQAEKMLKMEKEPVLGYAPDIKLSVEDNYYSHNKEFRYWLKHTKRTLWDDLDNVKAKELFQLFSEKWNTGDLPIRYYSGDPQSYVVKSSKGNGNAESSVFDADALFDRKKDSNRNIGIVTKRKNQFEIEEERERLRKERRKYRKHNEFVEEELVPKASSGREATLEKKKAKSQYTKAIDKGEITFSDDFLMGEESEYKKMLIRTKQRSQEKEEKRKRFDDEKKERKAHYDAKEQAILDRFRSVVASGDIPLMKYKQ